MLQAYVLTGCAIWAASFSFALLHAPPRAWEALTFVLLIGCGGLAVEATRRQGEPAGVLPQDMLSAWLLPIAFVLPPVYSLAAPVPWILLTQFRVRRHLVYRRVFTAATVGLSHAAASAAFHTAHSHWDLQLAAGFEALIWGALVIGCAVTALGVNSLLLAIAMKASSPETSWGELLFDKETGTLHWAEACIGTMVSVLCALHPLLILLAVTPVVLLQRGALHAQLSAAARLDAKTQLLNAPTWEREAAREVARAARTNGSLSVLLLDLDHFKPINDRYGHLAGDDVLRAVAGVLTAQTREYDMCARFGGDEFAVLLPQSDLFEAQQTAQRIRRHIAGLALPVGSEYIRVSVSVGVATLSSPSQEVTDLLAAADSELYRAKASRPPVHVTTERWFGDDLGGL